MGSGTVTAFGPGLSNGQVGTPATFTLVTRNAAPGMHSTRTSTESAFDSELASSSAGCTKVFSTRIYCLVFRRPVDRRRGPVEGADPNRGVEGDARHVQLPVRADGARRLHDRHQTRRPAHPGLSVHRPRRRRLAHPRARAAAVARRRTREHHVECVVPVLLHSCHVVPLIAICDARACSLSS